MVRIPKTLITATILVVAISLNAGTLNAGSLNAGAAGAQQMQVAATTVSGRTGDVYLMRGLMNVFSQGMDTLATELGGKGFQTKVINHSSWSYAAAQITERYKAAKRPEPVFLIGHSLGADAVILLAERLAENKVPVTLAVTFDPVHPRPAPHNVKRFVNFFQSNNGFGVPVKPQKGYRMSIVNTDLKDREDIGHTTIDKADFLHSKVVSEMMRLSRPIRRTVAGAG